MRLPMNSYSSLRCKFAGWIISILALISLCSLTTQADSRANSAPWFQSQSTVVNRVSSGATIPFSLVNNHVVLRVSINHSRPLSFVLDTGDQYALVNLETAKALGLKLRGQVRVSGAGATISTGAYVDNATFTLVSLPDFSQPITLALPIGHLATRFGQDFDGILGSEFIRQFILELDYEKNLITLHDKKTFTYSGVGTSIPIHLMNGHPVLTATVSVFDLPPTQGKFIFDIGAGLALALYSPFVREHHLLSSEFRTIQALAGSGAGGETVGRIGRVKDLRIGPYTIPNAITLFSQDTAGAFSNADLVGNIGARVAMRFRLFFDYDGGRIIFEPNSSFERPINYAFSGMTVTAEGQDYHTFRVSEVLNDSPAAVAGIEKGDVITAIDEKPAASLSLSALKEMLERPQTYSLKITREKQLLQVTLTPKLLP